MASDVDRSKPHQVLSVLAISTGVKPFGVHRSTFNVWRAEGAFCCSVFSNPEQTGTVRLHGARRLNAKERRMKNVLTKTPNAKR
jgi:hypothetical protein